MSDEELDPKEIILKNQRKEKKDLQAKIQALKKTASKGDKKKKKDVNDEISRLEFEMSERHKSELQKLESLNFEQNLGDVETLTEEISIDTNGAIDNDIETDANAKEFRVSKAQKRREKKAEKDKQRLIEIEKQEEENKNGIRNLEQGKIMSILKERSLTLTEIPSDGDCMFAGLVHQLSLIGLDSTVAELRKNTANELRENKADYSPFLSNPSSGEMLTDAEYQAYCSKMASTSAWGGQVELQAMATVLRRPIEVIQAEGPPMVVGNHFKSKPLVLTYHRHAYGLGEHYNSVSSYSQQHCS